MNTCKRLEIIIEEVLADRVIACLAKLEVSGYTLIPSVSGRGGRGERRNDEPAGTNTNCISGTSSGNNNNCNSSSS